jgi:L-histidine N-alpha-methyltransferase
MSTPARTAHIDVHLSAQDMRAFLEEDVRRGLSAHPKWLAPVWFYDERGSDLFDQITRLPEYYLTRAERSLLEENAKDIAAQAGADTLVELGAGTCEKSRILLDAMRSTGALRRYAPLDVSEVTLRAAAASLAAEYPGLQVNAVVADFLRHVDRLPSGGTRMIAFLGSTIGNLDPDQRRKFFFDLDCVMAHEDTLLLGTDLVKETSRLVAAYDDPSGVTADFNRNVLRVLNHELDANFDPDKFGHVALWNEKERWMEMRLRSFEPQIVEISALGLEVRFDAGEEMRTEISSKFTREGLEEELYASGFVVRSMWESPDGFLLTLAAPYC